MVEQPPHVSPPEALVGRMRIEGGVAVLAKGMDSWMEGAVGGEGLEGSGWRKDKQNPGSLSEDRNRRML